MMERTQPEAWLQTFTGRQFWPLEPDPADVHIEDIAHALANICRYGGHSNRFYSVAEHSVLVASRTGIGGLLHDAAEAYIGDMVRPLKHSSVMQPWYDEVEDRLLTAIYGGLLGIVPPSGLLLAAIKEADDRVLATEKRALHHAGHPWVLPAPYEGMAIKCLTPREAEALFLSEWERMRPARRGVRA